MKRIFIIFFILYTALSANEAAIVKVLQNDVKKEEIVQNTQCKIGFDTLVKASLEKHPSILVSKSMLESALAQIDSSEWEAYPTLSMDYSYKNSDKKKTIVTIEQPIFAGGRISAEINQAYAKKDEATASLDEAKLKLIDLYLKTIKDYMQSKSKIMILEENINEYKKLYVTFERMRKAGIMSQADKNLFDSKIAALKSEQIITNSKFEISKIKLEILSDQSIDCNINYDFRLILKNNFTVKSLSKNLEITHPTLKVLESKLRTAEEELAINKSVFSPKLSIKAEHRAGGIYDTTTLENENIAYASMTLNFGAGLSSFSNITKAKANINKAKMEILMRKKDLLDELVNNYLSLIKVKEQTKILLKDLWTTTQIYNSNKRLFKSQQKSWLDLVNSYSELSKQKIKYEELLIDENILENLISLESGLIDLNTFGIKE